jgi:hypothetical protein
VPVVIISTSVSYKVLQTMSDQFSVRILQRYGTVIVFGMLLYFLPLHELMSSEAKAPARDEKRLQMKKLFLFSMLMMAVVGSFHTWI